LVVIALEIPGALYLQTERTEQRTGRAAIVANGVSAPTDVALDRGNQLMLALQRGVPAALDQLVEMYHPKLYSFVVRMVGDGPAAEDIVQETWLSLYERRDSYTPTHRFSTWLFTIARRKALSELRRRRVRSIVRSMTTVDRNGDARQHDATQHTFAQPDAQADGAVVSVMVERALETMSPQQREVVLLRDVEGFDNEEIARILQWSLKPGAIRKRVFDARESFRRAMLALGYQEL
jgi:RNA polymerase sigma-70 factor (ECF subfamily)